MQHADSETLVQLCGPLALRYMGERVEDKLPGSQGRQLFAYLVVNRERHLSRDELREALWPKDAPSAPEMALSALLSKLRRLLGAEAIDGRTAIHLRLPEDTTVDVERAGDALHVAESHADAGEWDKAYGSALVSEYASKRGFLVGDEGAWIEEWRRKVEDIRMRALEVFSESCLSIGGSELRSAQRTARKLVADYPLRESGYRILMRALEAQGNGAEALQAYESLRCLMRDELGASPSPQTQEIHARLLAGAPN